MREDDHTPGTHPHPPRPLLLLDVDGVLNPFAAPTCPPGYREHGFFPDDDPPVRLNDSHAHWLALLADRFDLAWATGWEDEANTYLSPFLGLPRLPVVRFPPVPFAPAEKVPPIAAFAGDRPTAWVDDAHTPEAREWAELRKAPTLLVATDPAQGLTRAAVEELLGWKP
ncbi:HAD domain-containing protein [Streptomyces sp. NPDC094466]|uniref:HAD domain-containing protein n=1 Tax=Streptomyces sp. NPDC094466 TaxID=3366065 RepID=UPI00382DFBEA